MTAPLRLAFAEIRSDEWPAGAIYSRNLFLALRSLEAGERPELTLLREPRENISTGASDALMDRVLEEPRPPRLGFVRQQARRVRRKLGLYRPAESPAGPLLRQHGINALFTNSAHRGRGFGVPLLAWLPDFQFLHMPELFPEETRNYFRRNFAEVAQRATLLVLSSHDALNDLRNFAPEQAGKGRVLQFVAQVPDGIHDDDDPASVCARYHLPKRFLYLPNQFWKSKNHEVVVRALGLLRDRRPEIKVVCSGGVQEPRSPLYPSRLLSLVSELNVRESFVVLGFLADRDDVFRLIRQSLAVLQPSLFEGWASSVEECKSIGKGMVLSDLPIHREQDPSDSLFFDPHSPEALAACLERIFDERTPGPDVAMEKRARERLAERTRSFARLFLQIAREATTAP